MSYCPQCGVMRPLIKERDRFYISNNNKVRVANKIAGYFSLGMTELGHIARRIKTNDRYEFARRFSIETQLPFNDVARFCL